MEGNFGIIRVVWCIGLLSLVQEGNAYIVVEEGTPNMFIGNIASDYNFTQQINEGMELRFSFLYRDQPHVAHFNISESTGDLYTVGVLDREQVCLQATNCTVTLKIAVTATKFSFIEKRDVVITIIDINDHSPKFSVPSQSLSIPENSQIGTSFTLEGAVDPDSPKYSVKLYSIRPLASPFSTRSVKNLDGSSSVQIIVEEELDREVAEHYQIQIIAEDGDIPPRTGTLLVNITVADVNDNAPSFTHGIYNVSVNEDIAINSTILQVSANDPDIGSFGEITYSFATNQKQSGITLLFAIDPISGNITTIGQLVYSLNHMYEIIVEARDGGVNPKVSQALVHINIQDVNNNPPNIVLNLLSSSNFAKVSELANIGAVVALIGVTDDDGGWNGITNCTMDSDFFGLLKSEETEYNVIVKMPLDRETEAWYTLTVLCEDLGNPPLSSAKSFNVSVLDENDHKPVFLPSDKYDANILEKNNYGDIVLVVEAQDADSGNNAKITYELRGEAWTDFVIDESGTVRTMKIFDREEKDMYMFTVVAMDGGEKKHTSTATVTIHILDQNDNRPTFLLTYYEFHVPENVQLNEVFGQVSANDLDAENNGIVTYSIIDHPDDDLPFKLDPNGYLRIKQTLNRETQIRYDFIVLASDQGFPHRLNSSANVSVFVTDVNDNSPYFVSPQNPGRVVYVPVSTAVNTPLYLIQANDIDDGENALLTFKIEERNDSHIFDINDSGQIVVARPIEKREINTYVLQIVVYDNGTPRNFAKTSLTMSLMVENSTAESGSSSDGLQSKNLLIALTVVIVTVVLAATIVVTIFVIRRIDKKKQDFFGTDSNSDGSLEAEVVPGLNLCDQKDFCGPTANNTLQLGPMSSHLSVDQHSTTKDYIYKPRMNVSQDFYFQIVLMLYLSLACFMGKHAMSSSTTCYI